MNNLNLDIRENFRATGTETSQLSAFTQILFLRILYKISVIFKNNLESALGKKKGQGLWNTTAIHFTELCTMTPRMCISSYPPQKTK